MLPVSQAWADLQSQPTKRGQMRSKTQTGPLQLYILANFCFTPQLDFLLEEGTPGSFPRQSPTGEMLHLCKWVDLGLTTIRCVFCWHSHDSHTPESSERYIFFKYIRECLCWRAKQNLVFVFETLGLESPDCQRTKGRRESTFSFHIRMIKDFIWRRKWKTCRKQATRLGLQWILIWINCVSLTLGYCGWQPRDIDILNNCFSLVPAWLCQQRGTAWGNLISHKTQICQFLYSFAFSLPHSLHSQSILFISDFYQVPWWELVSRFISHCRKRFSGLCWTLESHQTEWQIYTSKRG